jgi:PAS domain S-box-containing protein
MRRFKPVTIIRESFPAKIFSLIIVGISILSIVFTSVYVYHERESSFETLITRGNLLSGLLAYNASLPVFSENYFLLDNAINGIMARDGVLSAAVYNHNGSLLAERMREGSEQLTGSPGRPYKGKIVTSPGFEQSEEVIEFLAPVSSGKVVPQGESLFFSGKSGEDAHRLTGVARVILDKRGLNRRLEHILISSIMITLLFLVCGSVAAYAVVRGMTRPLQRLSEGVQSLERGDLSTRIAVETQDEMGQLAHAFNSMVAALNRRDEQNRALAEELRIAQKMEAKEEWERTFDTVPDLIAIIDTDMKIMRINRAMAERLGISKDAAAGRLCSAVIHDVALSDLVCLHGMLPEQGLTQGREFYEPKLDSHFWLTVTPLRKADGELAGYVNVARDISERKKAEEERKLIQAKLIQANKMTSLGLLVSGMAHEVNNPNNNVKLAAHLLSRAWQDIDPILEEYYRKTGDFVIGGHPFSQVKDSLPGYIAGIAESSRRIEGIIRNLRDFVRKGKANVSSLTDVNMVVTVSAAILNFQIKRHTARFSLELSEELPPVRGNSQLLEQVVINLIMNAIQSLADKGRSVTVSTYADPSRDEVVIRVADEGCGMTDDVRQRIFDPFFSTKLDRGGTGLGLAISNVIVQDHNGSLVFDSLPDVGTTAEVRLPASSLPGEVDGSILKRGDSDDA